MFKGPYLLTMKMNCAKLADGFTRIFSTFLESGLIIASVSCYGDVTECLLINTKYQRSYLLILVLLLLFISQFFFPAGYYI